jgi:hypothetical protein
VSTTTLQSFIYANVVFLRLVMVHISPDLLDGYLIWALVDQLNKILEILGVSIADISLWVISD